MNAKITMPPVHPAADFFPLLDESRLSQLAESIRQRGQINPIVMYEGAILDGRNRWLACERAGVTPRTVEWHGDNPYLYVRDSNERRDLDPGQRAAILFKLDRAATDYDAKQRAKRDAANRARSEAAKEQHTTANPRRGERSGPVSRDTAPKQDERTRVDLAARAGVSTATAARVQALGNKRPDLLDAVASGSMGLAEAARQVKREEVTEKLAALPADKYRVIYADPPWQYNDQRAGLDSYSQTAAADHYPTMSVAELSALDVRGMAADDAVLFCWATFPLLPDALEVVKAWGFKYKTALVWDKVRPNFGHYHNASAELLLICTRGSGTPEIKQREDQVQVVEREGRHSAKPEHFRSLIDRLYPTGNRIELFRRGAAPGGWSVWGNEAA